MSSLWSVGRSQIKHHSHVKERCPRRYTDWWCGAVLLHVMPYPVGTRHNPASPANPASTPLSSRQQPPTSRHRMLADARSTAMTTNLNPPPAPRGLATNRQRRKQLKTRGCPRRRLQSSLLRKGLILGMTYSWPSLQQGKNQTGTAG